MIAQLGNPPVLALTATAAPPVRADALDRLGLHDPVEVIESFDRPNLHLAAVLHSDEVKRRAAVVDRAAALAAENGGRGLVYCAARAEPRRLVDALRLRGVGAEAYNAGLGRARREAVHDRFTAGTTRVVVATSAFGMGIDQPDVRSPSGRQDLNLRPLDPQCRPANALTCGNRLFAGRRCAVGRGSGPFRSVELVRALHICSMSIGQRVRVAST